MRTILTYGPESADQPIRFRLTRSDGEPISGARVWCTILTEDGEEVFTELRTELTDENGHAYLEESFDSTDLPSDEESFDVEAWWSGQGAGGTRHALIEFLWSRFLPQWALVQDNWSETDYAVEDGIEWDEDNRDLILTDSTTSNYPPEACLVMERPDRLPTDTAVYYEFKSVVEEQGSESDDTVLWPDIDEAGENATLGFGYRMDGDSGNTVRTYDSPNGDSFTDDGPSFDEGDELIHRVEIRPDGDDWEVERIFDGDTYGTDTFSSLWDYDYLGISFEASPADHVVRWKQINIGEL